MELLPTSAGCGVIPADSIADSRVQNASSMCFGGRALFQPFSPCNGAASVPFTAYARPCGKSCHLQGVGSCNWNAQALTVPPEYENGNTLFYFSPGFKGKARCSDGVFGSGQVLCSFQTLESFNRHLSPSDAIRTMMLVLCQ